LESEYCLHGAFSTLTNDQKNPWMLIETSACRLSVGEIRKCRNQGRDSVNVAGTPVAGMATITVQQAAAAALLAQRQIQQQQRQQQRLK
jgi:hypothetical protein